MRRICRTSRLPNRQVHLLFGTFCQTLPKTGKPPRVPTERSSIASPSAPATGVTSQTSTPPLPSLPWLAAYPTNDKVRLQGARVGRKKARQDKRVSRNTSQESAWPGQHRASPPSSTSRRAWTRRLERSEWTRRPPGRVPPPGPFSRVASAATAAAFLPAGFGRSNRRLRCYRWCSRCCLPGRPGTRWCPAPIAQTAPCRVL